VHELTLSRAIVDTVLRHARDRRVTAVSLRVGRLRQVVPDTLAFYFALVARGTLCEGARLEQQPIGARLRCDACGHRWELAVPAFRCPQCDGADVHVIAGEELEVESIEVEEVAWHRTKVKVVEEALDANNTIARANRADFDRAGVRVVNLMSAPGAGKTSLLERVIADLPGVRAGVLEGDVRGSLDADRLAGLHVAVTQINTDPGFGGECHLDANMVRSALGAMPLEDIDLLVIENVGNLVCPAEFRVGEDRRVMVSSVTEGEDKPLKYPLMFRTCDLVLVNKIDLLPHLDYDLERFLYNLDQVHPGVARLMLSARSGAGVEPWRRWLLAVAAREGARA
jgi:hydrogenase nickel incorporation protein HypB